MSDRSNLFGDLLPGIRVGIDMDGVLADFNTGWMSRYNAEFGASLDASMVQEWNGLHGLTHFATMGQFWEWAQGDGRSTFRDAPPLPGAIEGIKRIGAKHRVYFKRVGKGRRLGSTRIDEDGTYLEVDRDISDLRGTRVGNDSVTSVQVRCDR